MGRSERRAFHPREPSPLDVALAIAETVLFAPACAALSVTIWAPGAAVRAWRRIRG